MYKMKIALQLDGRLSTMQIWTEINVSVSLDDAVFLAIKATPSSHSFHRHERKGY